MGSLIIRKFPYPLGQYLTRSPPGYTRCPLKSIVLSPDDHFFIFGKPKPKNENLIKIHNEPLRATCSESENDLLPENENDLDPRKSAPHPCTVSSGVKITQ